jgi:superfamily II DNA or RNA helicase
VTIGAKNTLRITPVNHEHKQIGPSTEVEIFQTGEPDDIEALVKLLDQMGSDVLENIKTDPGRHEYVVRQAEQVLIRKFSGSFAKGKAYVENLIAEAKSSAVRKVLKAVLKRFIAIDNTVHSNIKKNHPLYFFQKYCVAEIQSAIAEGKNGIVLANDPGLGKTRTALVAVNGDPATIITPNSVVTSWEEEAQKALVDPDILVLQDMHSKDRKELLRTSKARHTVTNVEFLRSTEGDERYDLLSNKDTIVVQDEAHGLLNLSTEQSKGARRLSYKFLLLLSATPAKDPKTLRRILHLLEPADPRFSSDKAFTTAFPGNDPKALKTLSVLKQQYMIRFTKEDVLETMDPRKPISQQKHCLPRKEHIPEDQMGSFTLTEDQCEAMYELLLNFPEWTEKYDKYVPKDAIAREDQLRGNSNSLVKTHALRQTANNPSYVGSKEADPKAAEMQRTVDAMLAEGRKVVIFCQYNAQAQKYAELLKAHCPSLYTGLTSKQGNRTGPDGKPLLYKKNTQGAWVMDNRGLPQEDPNGEPMSALDYERLSFQNAPERRVMISTYAAGAVGVTFTAGKATIFDDLPDDIVKEIQAEDRTHRIDHEHQTHHSVKYVRMVSRYPQSFLEKMKKVWVRQQSDGTYEEVTNRKEAEREELETAYETFFAQGTYDEVRLAGLATQRMRFRLINDGIADPSELPEIKNLVA